MLLRYSQLNIVSGLCMKMIMRESEHIIVSTCRHACDIITTTEIDNACAYILTVLAHRLQLIKLQDCAYRVHTLCGKEQ
jgi:hypothetical protein